MIYNTLNIHAKSLKLTFVYFIFLLALIQLYRAVFIHQWTPKSLYAAAWILGGSSDLVHRISPRLRNV